MGEETTALPSESSKAGLEVSWALGRTWKLSLPYLVKLLTDPGQEAQGWGIVQPRRRVVEGLREGAESQRAAGLGRVEGSYSRGPTGSRLHTGQALPLLWARCQAYM